MVPVAVSASDPGADDARSNIAGTDQQVAEIELLRERVDELRIQVEALLASLRSDSSGATVDAAVDPRDLEADADGPPTRPLIIDYGSSRPSQQRIEEALESETTLEFQGSPLSEVIDFLSQLHNITIVLDEQPLLEAGVNPDEEVSLVVSGIRLRSALDAMLKSMTGVELDYVIEDEVLKITTRRAADRVMDTRVYSMRHLAPSYTTEDLARIVRSTIRPWTWRSKDESAAKRDGARSRCPRTTRHQG